MKKNYVLLFVLAAGLLVVSCGKSRKPEVKEAAKIASEGIFGSIGEDLVYLMDDYQLLEEEYKAKNDELREEVFDKNRESSMSKLIERGKALEEEEEEKMEKINKQFASYVDKLKGEELPTELAEGVPLKLISPFSVVGISEMSNSMIVEAKVEVLTDRPALGGYTYGFKYVPCVSFIDENGTELYKDQDYTTLKNFAKKLTTGSTNTVSFSVALSDNKELPKILAAKKISICWEHPNK